jgi:hypothetical protein
MDFTCSLWGEGDSTHNWHYSFTFLREDGSEIYRTEVFHDCPKMPGGHPPPVETCHHQWLNMSNVVYDLTASVIQHYGCQQE